MAQNARHPSRADAEASAAASARKRGRGREEGDEEVEGEEEEAIPRLIPSATSAFAQAATAAESADPGTG
jgi:hypothetical protein